MTVLTAEEILNALGYHREDTLFVGLNMTDEQYAVLQDAEMASGCETVEETITVACQALLKQETWGEKVSQVHFAQGSVTIQRPPGRG
jgi:hypothetical protein